MGRAARRSRRARSAVRVTVAVLLLAALGAGCGARTARMEVTAYCGCGACSGWERGSWKYLKLNFWNRYVSVGPRKGQPYSGLTASGTKPHEPHPGLFSVDSMTHPWVVPFRLIFPWLWFARDGTLAADTRYYPFGTRFYVPGYGYGSVEDRGSGVKGPHRLEVYFGSHHHALRWGRQRIDVQLLD